MDVPIENGKFWLKFLSALGILLITFAIGYGVLNQKVNENCDDIKEIKSAVKETNDKAIRLDVRMEHLIETVGRIERLLIDGENKNTN